MIYIQKKAHFQKFRQKAANQTLNINTSILRMHIYNFSTS